eukprot:2185050-Amphidinium_carterae.1
MKVSDLSDPSASMLSDRIRECWHASSQTSAQVKLRSQSTSNRPIKHPHLESSVQSLSNCQRGEQQCSTTNPADDILEVQPHDFLRDLVFVNIIFICYMLSTSACMLAKRGEWQRMCAASSCSSRADRDHLLHWHQLSCPDG